MRWWGKSMLPFTRSQLDTQFVQDLENWLNAPGVREKRRFLEAHRGLLSTACKDALRHLIAHFAGQQPQSDELLELLALIHDIRQRGDSIEAIRDGYVNVYGGLALDAPVWLEAVERQLGHLLASGLSEQSASARIALLRSAIEHAQADPQLPATVGAALRNLLANALGNVVDHQRPQALEEQIALYRATLQAYPPARYSYMHANMLKNLGNAYQERIAGSRRDNLEQAITCYQAALGIRTAEAFPVEFAHLMNNLGNAFLFRIAGDRQENQEQAIRCYREALRIRTLETYPIEYAQTMNNLGNAFLFRIADDQRSNLEQAIRCYREALCTYTRESFPLDYAQTMSNLGAALAQRIEGEGSVNQEEAIACFRAALQVRTREAFPFYYAQTMENLGLVYASRLAGDQGENREEVIACCRRALEVYTLSDFPVEWASAQNRLGLAYAQRIHGDESSNQEEAIACFHAALQVRTREAFPLEYAQTAGNLGEALRTRKSGERSANQEEAIACFRAALSIVTPDMSPVDYSQAMNNLGACLAQRLAGDRKANLEEAIACFHAALRVRTLTEYPLDFALTMENLGQVYCNRGEGNRRENLTQAAAIFQAALQVYTQQTFPAEWATIQVFLGEVYESLLDISDSEATQTEHQRNALTHYSLALLVYTRETHAEEWAAIQRHLGDAYSKPIREHHLEHLQEAVACYTRALDVLALESFPTQWAATQHSLGMAYINLRVHGNMGENVERAIACFSAALQVYTREAYPTEWARVQSSLGIAYSDAIYGNSDEAAERSIASYSAALKVFDRETAPFEWAMIQRELGSIYTHRQLGNHRENLERAIAYCRNALQALTATDDPVEWARAQEALGVTYRQRSEGQRNENLEFAITCFTAALQVYTYAAFPFEWAEMQQHMGDTYLLQNRGSDGANVERAIACYRNDLTTRTRDTAPVVWALTQETLGNAYELRIQGNRSENWAQSVQCYTAALQVFTPETLPNDHRNTSLRLAALEAQRANWLAANAAYQAANQTEQLLLALAAGIKQQDIVLRRGLHTATNHAYVLSRLGRAEDALLAAERGRAHGIAEARALDAADPARIGNPVLRGRYIAAREAFINAQRALNLLRQDARGILAEQPDYLAHVDAFHHAKQMFDAVASEIRAARDPADFLQDTLDIAAIWQAAGCGGEGHALVYLLYTPWGGAAIAAISADSKAGLPNRCATLTIPALLEGLPISLLEGSYTMQSHGFLGGYALAQSANGFKHLLDSWPGTTLAMKAEALHTFCTRNRVESSLDTAVQDVLAHPRIAALATRPLDALTAKQRAQIAATLEHTFLRPELERSLKEFSHTMRTVARWLERERASSVTIIPCGMLAAFPLLAAPINDIEDELPTPQEWRTLGDSIPASIAPSARALLPAGSSTTSRAGVYTIGDPQWRTHPIPWSEAEARILAQLARSAGMLGEAHVQESATRAWLLDAVGKAQIVDVSCHGTFDSSDVLRSRLFLADGEPLLMGEILGKVAELGGLRLFLLSACQTALVDVYGAADEVHSLTTSMLQAGAKAVLGSLWSVDDRATYLLMARFAQEWFPRMAHEPPAAALARSQRWLRNVTNRELRAWRNMQSSDEASGRTEPEDQQAADADVRQAEYVGVRGRGSRYSMSYAQTLIRQRAQRSDADECPFADPIYWAAFQLSGW